MEEDEPRPKPEPDIQAGEEGAVGGPDILVDEEKVGGPDIKQR